MITVNLSDPTAGAGATTPVHRPPLRFSLPAAPAAVSVHSADRAQSDEPLWPTAAMVANAS